MYKLVVDGFHYETENLQELVGLINEDYHITEDVLIMIYHSESPFQFLKDYLISRGFKLQ